MVHKFNIQSRMENNFISYQEVARLEEETRTLFLDDLHLDFMNNSWFEANLSAPVGAILSKVKAGINEVHFENMNPAIEKILRKNKFLTFYGYPDHVDTYGTCVSYSTFKPSDSKLFSDYIEKELFLTKQLPSMSDGLKKHIKKSISEVFVNTGVHGNAKRVFSCGQYFPMHQRLDFTVANLGKTFDENVSEYFGYDVSSIDSIEWATQKDTTTRKGNIPGGLGLFTLLSFLQQNHGRVHIISGNGYWVYGKDGAVKLEMQHYFKGAIVNIEFNLNDKTSYVLATELDQNNIF